MDCLVEEFSLKHKEETGHAEQSSAAFGHDEVQRILNTIGEPFMMSIDPTTGDVHDQPKM